MCIYIRSCLLKTRRTSLFCLIWSCIVISMENHPQLHTKYKHSRYTFLDITLQDISFVCNANLI